MELIYEGSADYVIAGGGTCGCVLASRLSESPSTTVALIEAGSKPKSPWMQIPIGIGKILGEDSHIWRYKASTDLARSLELKHGRMLSGSGGINAMLFVRGEPARYQEWAKTGCPGWDYESCLPYFRKLETVSFDAGKSRGRTGKMPVSRLEAEDHISQAFLDSCKNGGIPYNKDYNSGTTFGSALLQLNTKRGFRWNVEKAYLRPARKRANLRIETNALVERILFEGKKAIGVEYVQNQKRMRIRANREVILSAGALHSPKILELSGVGRPDVLTAHGLPVLVELPGVGENLRDHLHTRISFKSNGVKTANDLLNNRLFAAREFIKYTILRRGLFSTPSFRTTAFQSSPLHRYPDIRIQCGLTSSANRDASGGVDDYSGFHLGSYYLYPESSGHVHIKDTNPASLPEIHERHLDCDSDISATIWALKEARRISLLSPLNDLICLETRPSSAACSDQDLLDHVRNTAETSWHPVGSCKMGICPMSVVDHQLRVQGLEGLRIADASVMPFHTSSNTHIPTIMIGEKAAALIQS